MDLVTVKSGSLRDGGGIYPGSVYNDTPLENSNRFGMVLFRVNLVKVSTTGDTSNIGIENNGNSFILTGFEERGSERNLIDNPNL